MDKVDTAFLCMTALATGFLLGVLFMSSPEDYGPVSDIRVVDNSVCRVYTKAVEERKVEVLLCNTGEIKVNLEAGDDQ